LPRIKKDIRKEDNKKETIRKTNGIPMSEESYKEWLKAFDDINESIDYMLKHKHSDI
jgi:hypothetical protein